VFEYSSEFDLSRWILKST